MDLAATSESVVREFLRSAQAADRGTKRKRNSTDLAATSESVVREFLRSAKGAARTAKPSQELLAPHSVLREFLSRSGGRVRVRASDAMFSSPGHAFVRAAPGRCLSYQT